MMERIRIENFKCFKLPSSFRFSELNLLTGINGRGKSSLLQSILVLSQSAQESNDLRSLEINGQLVRLGNYDDIRNSETSRSENITFEIDFSDQLIKKAKIVISENVDDPLRANFEEIRVELSASAKIANSNDAIRIFSEAIRQVHFVSADRLGPVRYVDKISLPSFLHVGPKGEKSINILANSMNMANVNELLYRGDDSSSIIQQTAEWMSYVLGGAKIDIGGNEKESSVLYMLLNNKPNSFSYKPANVGFGYSYIMPLIITGLIAKPGEIIIVENPEAHLHPRAQSKLAEFFALVAATGVQVFIESHSEHILNGFRVSAINPQIPLDYSELTIHYFDESFESVELTLDSKGKIENWPEGFFDQQELDLAEIFKHGRLI